MQKTFLPWRLLIPIVVVVGIGLTLWSGIFLLTSAKENWEDLKKQEANLVTQEVSAKLKALEVELKSLVALFNAPQTLVGLTDETGLQDAINHLSAVQGKSAEQGHLSAVVYQQPNGSLLKAHIGKVWHTPLEETILTLQKKPTAFIRGKWQPVGTTNLHLPAHHVLLVRPFDSYEKTQGALFAFVDLEKLLFSQTKNVSSFHIHILQSGTPLAQLTLRTQKQTLRETQNTISQKISMFGADWLLIWQPDASTLAQDPNYIPGLMVLIVGMLMTATFGWVIWMQQSMAENVRAQVVERTNLLEQASRRFRLITDNAYDLIAITTPDGTLEYVNSAFHRVLGYNREELRERPLANIVHERDIPRLEDSLAQVLKGRNAIEVPIRTRHKNGEWRYMEAVVKGLHDADWVLKNIVLHMRDITSRKRFADDLARSEQRFRDFADSSADWLWEVDAKLGFTYVSPGVSRVLGYEPQEMIGHSLFKMLFEQEQDPTRDLIETRIQRNQPYRDIEFWTRSKEGERICLRMSGVPTHDEKQNFSGYRGVASNITASKIDREVTYKLATTDHLTGLLNRRRFMEELERSVSLAKRHNTQGVLMFIDLDRFKEINDTHGHEAGDEILRGVTDIFKTCFRSTDIIARLGGDEFAMIMHNIDVPGAQLKVQEMIDRVNAFEVDYKGAKLTVTMSIGMIVYPQEDKMGEELMMAADLAMYRAKDLGRNRMYVDAEGTDGEDIDSVRNQLKWVNRLRTCLETGDFEMHFQPIVPAKKAVRPLFEALLRIYDEDGNVGSPAIYIDAAEHFGLIQRLDLAVVERCFKTQHDLKTDGIDVDFSINLSSRSFGDTEVMDSLRVLMKQYDIDPNRIVFEVTETMAIHDPSAFRDIGEIRAFISELRDMGFRFAIDDFGAGFTSFQYIRLLPVDVVKIDGAFVKDLETNVNDRFFIESITTLCKGLNIKTIAEFVENEAILDILADLGVDYAQGWHLGKPQKDIVASEKAFVGKTMFDFMERSPTPAAKNLKKPAPKTVRKAASSTKKTTKG